MPNRIVRPGILDSDKVNLLSWSAEVFFRRLMSVVDDFGRYDGRISVIRSQLYPLRLDRVSDADVDKWLQESCDAGLVSVYQVSGKRYLEIVNFGQTLRIKKSKFPAPDVPCKQMQADASRRMSEIEGETKSNIEIEIGVEIEMPKSSFDRDQIFKKVFQYMRKNKSELYPNEDAQLQRQLDDLQKQCDHDVSLAQGLPVTNRQSEIEKIHKKVTAKIEAIDKRFEKMLTTDFNDMFDFYKARNFKIEGQTIVHWNSVVKGWIRKKTQFDKKKSA